MQLPPPDAILGSVNKDFEECCPIKRFQNKHNTKHFQNKHNAKHLQNKVLKHNSKAFTLAEVLITLVVIGVIAAITVPVMVQSYKKRVASEKIVQFYSMLKQAEAKSKIQGKDWKDWADTASSSSDNTATTAKNFAHYYLLPYLQYTKTEINGKDFNVYLNNGSYFKMEKNYCIDFMLDINGTKKPNVEGKDIFWFIYCPYSWKNDKTAAVIRPNGIGTYNTRTSALNACKQAGKTCIALLYFDSWEFKSDYPYKI